ncbi:MAG TPA: ABC transporter permease [Dehalococcoidia bacterium]|nr:ABC transporter permease [Dehalococcoidia bacterium]
MNLSVIRALVAKDFALFFRNRFYAYITFLGIVFYLIIYFVMPSSVDEELDIGLYAPVLPPAFKVLQTEEGFNIVSFDSDESLKDAVTEGIYHAGVSLPVDIMEKFTSGEKPLVTLYFSTSATEEVVNAIETTVRELAYLQTGQTLAIDISSEVLGTDMLGNQIPTRDRLRVMLVIVLVMFEMMGLASLISEEVEQGTIRALLITPMSTRELFAGKLIMGTGLAFVQGVLFMAIVGGLNQQSLLIITMLLLGSAMFTGTGFLVASLSRDMLSSMGWGVTILLIYAIPAFGVMFPGIITGWAKAIPSYYLVDTVHRASNFNASWGENWVNLLILFGFNIVIIWCGIMALRRRFQ